MLATPPADCLRGLLVGRSLVEFALRYCQVLIELAKPRQIAGGQLHPRRGMTAGPEEEIALLMRRWEQVKAGDGAVVLIGGEPGNREIAPRAAAHRVAEARRNSYADVSGVGHSMISRSGFSEGQSARQLNSTGISASPFLVSIDRHARRSVAAPGAS